MASRSDNDFAATASFTGNTANGFHRLDVSTTAATYTNLPAGTYVVRMTGGIELVSIRTGGTAADPASGAAGTGGAFASGDTYTQSAAGDASVIVLGGAGSGRVYLVRVVA